MDSLSNCTCQFCWGSFLHTEPINLRVVCNRLPAVEETILRRKKRIDAAQARQARANLHAKKVLISS